MSETVVVQRRRRRRPSRRLIELIREKLREIKERHEDIIRLKHEIGTSILNDPDYQTFQESGNQRFASNQRGFVRELAESLRVSVSNLHQCIKFASKFPDIDTFIMHYKGQLGENFTWFYITQNLLYEPRREEEETEEEVRLRPTVVADIVEASEDREEQTTLIQAVREYKLTKREDASELIEKVQQWKRGEVVRTFFHRPVASDTPFEEAVREIARYIRERRLNVPYKGEVLEDLEEVYRMLSPSVDLVEFIRQCTLLGRSILIGRSRPFPRTTLRLPAGETNDGEGED